MGLLHLIIINHAVTFAYSTQQACSKSSKPKLLSITLVLSIKHRNASNYLVVCIYKQNIKYKL